VIHTHFFNQSILTFRVVIMETFSQRYRHVIGSEAFRTTPLRPPFSEHPTFTSGTDQGFFSPNPAYHLSPTRRETNGSSTPRIRIQASTPEKSTESTPREFQPVPMQIDHLKSLITMARAQCNSEIRDSDHFASIVPGCPIFRMLMIYNTGKFILVS
jgi:hypothetical protein